MTSRDQSRSPTPTEPEADIDAFRRRITRDISDFLEGWRDCDLHVCRRHRRCADDSFACMSKPPGFSPEEQAAAMADVQRAVKARLAGAAE